MKRKSGKRKLCKSALKLKRGWNEEIMEAGGRKALHELAH